MGKEGAEPPLTHPLATSSGQEPLEPCAHAQTWPSPPPLDSRLPRLFPPSRSVWRYHGVWRGPRMLFVARVTQAAEGNRGGGCRAAMVTNPVHGLPFLPGSSFTDSTVRAGPKGSPLGAPLLSSIAQTPPPSSAASAGFARPLGSPHTFWVPTATLFLLSSLTYLPSGPITPGRLHASPQMHSYPTKRLFAFIRSYLLSLATHSQALLNPQDRCLSAPFPVCTRTLFMHSFSMSLSPSLLSL